MTVAELIGELRKKLRVRGVSGDPPRRTLNATISGAAVIAWQGHCQGCKSAWCVLVGAQPERPHPLRCIMCGAGAIYVRLPAASA